MSTSDLVGAPRACRHCGKSIRFRQTYGTDGTRKYLPANPDGTDHRCLVQGTKGAVGTGNGRPRTEYDVILDMAAAMHIDTGGQSINQLADAIGQQLGKTRAEVYQQAQNLLKLEGLNGSGVRGNSGGSGGDASGSEIDALVDQAVEQAFGSGVNSGGEASTGGEGSSGEGSQSQSAEADNGTENGENANGEGSEGSSGEAGEPEEGSGSGEAPKGDAEGVPQPEQGTAGQEEAGEEGKEGSSESGKAGEKKAAEEKVKEKKREQVTVDKEVLKRIAQALKDQIKEETTRKEVKELKFPTADTQDITDQHYLFGEFVQLLVEGEKPFLAGPAGSGKTTAALNAAPILGKVFERDDYQTYVKSFCLMSGKHELEGFIDANGVCQDTDFRKAFTEGHLFFMDEVDAANPNVLLVLNAAIENGIMSFPDGMCRRHDHFRLGVGANTVGLGADAQYSGRTQLDAAFRNRFYFLAWEYDEKMELKWAGEDQQEWVLYVQALRKAQQSMGKSAPRVVISPRASIRGARRLRSGVVSKDDAGFQKLAEALIWQGCHEDDKARIMANVGGGRGKGRGR